ncbi:TfoX/Sxy family protein [Devosia sp. BK]|uniref:TfoX/Sxy family protein n=1 Tax=Devosia sp. BK TaxID=2871706 RepID=UPI002939AE44|nr:TfoX/Sxy family protein [Devosia sp. BK]MDV3250502.1 TfoX/Sxy family protein [Devosia sp. BK]
MSLACDELSDRVRDVLGPLPFLTERKMFGGRAFMQNGNMLCCPTKEGSLIVRVGKDGMDEALAISGASIMDMGGRSMTGFVVVSGDALEDDDNLADWLGRCRRFVATLPAK